VFTASLNAEP